MEKENNIVKASIDIGTFIPDEKCPRFHLCTDIGDSKVEEKRERMKGLGLPQEWAEDSQVFILNVEEGAEEEVQNMLDSVFLPEYKGIVKGAVDRDNRQRFRRFSCTSQGKVMFARKPAEDLLKMVKEMKKPDPEFDAITKDQVNKLEFTLDLGHDFDQIMDLHEKQGYTLLLAVCKLLSFELEASFHPDLPTMAKDFIMDSMKNILRLNPPAELVLAAMNTLKGLDVNFQFNSTDQLPEQAKKLITSEWGDMMKFYLPMMAQSSSKQDKDIIGKLCQKLISVEYISTEQSGVTVHANLKATGFSTFVKKFF